MPKRMDPADKAVNGWTQLAICILMDVLGMITYFIPAIGEMGDLVYAPIQAAVAWWMFSNESWGMGWIILAGAEELAPFTDVFPSMTIGWCIKWMM